jgi:hypothetical protein
LAEDPVRAPSAIGLDQLGVAFWLQQLHAGCTAIPSDPGLLQRKVQPFKRPVDQRRPVRRRGVGNQGGALGEPAILTRYDIGNQPLAVLWPVGSDNYGTDRWMLLQHRFDLPQFDPMTANLDLEVFPSQKLDIAVGQVPSEVPGMEMTPVGYGMMMKRSLVLVSSRQ